MLKYILKNKKILIILSILLLSFIGNIIWYLHINNYSDNIHIRFSKEIANVYNNIEHIGEKFVFIDDSLVYWSDNTITFSENINDTNIIIELSNGFYLHKITKKNDTVNHYLYLIKYQYNTENNYLNNNFNKPFIINNQIDIVNYQTDYPIIYNNKTIGYLDMSPECLSPSKKNIFIFRLWLVINIFFLCVTLLYNIKLFL